jgi:hypothetical protein
MKHAVFACAAVLVLSGAAFAGNSPVITPTAPGANVPSYPLPAPTPCATGFTQAGVNGSPSGSSYAYECHTPKIICPKAPPGMVLLTEPPKVNTAGGGVQFTYYCAYDIPPK